MAGKCGHDHEHETKPGELGNLYTLFLKIDLGKVQCLNECTDGSGKNIFKAWDERLDTEKVYTCFSKQKKNALLLFIFFSQKKICYYYCTVSTVS